MRELPWTFKRTKGDISAIQGRVRAAEAPSVSFSGTPTVSAFNWDGTAIAALQNQPTTIVANGVSEAACEWLIDTTTSDFAAGVSYIIEMTMKYIALNDNTVRTRLLRARLDIV